MIRFTFAFGFFALSAALIGCQSTASPARAEAKLPAGQIQPTEKMQAILDAHKSLDPKPLPHLSVEDARQQPSMTDAVMAYKRQNNMSTAPLAGVTTVNTQADGVPVRIYTPDGGAKNKPVILYIHGGGWVIATIDTYDASARALAKGTDAVVVATEYRKAPENPFPASHEDNFTAYQWILSRPDALKSADLSRVAVAGESAGGNMATSLCLMAQDRNVRQPLHQVLVYPVTGSDMATPSYQQNAEAKPLSKAAMEWFFDKEARSGEDLRNPYLVPIRAGEQKLARMPPATIVTAAIDPLRSDGAMYAQRLEEAGVNVAYRNYDGVTHEFFGMADVVDQARDAQAFVIERLNAAFASPSRQATASD